MELQDCILVDKKRQKNGEIVIKFRCKEEDCPPELERLLQHYWSDGSLLELNIKPFQPTPAEIQNEHQPDNPVL